MRRLTWWQVTLKPDMDNAVNGDTVAGDLVVDEVIIHHEAAIILAECASCARYSVEQRHLRKKLTGFL